MRVKLKLAITCWDTGDRRQAIEHGWEMLRLNPNDHQGIRYLLLRWLLLGGSIEEIERLLSTYDEEGSADWLFNRALHHFRIGGPSPNARKALRQALQSNVHVAGLLLGDEPLPEGPPSALIGFGDETEAYAYIVDGIGLWGDTYGALDWLADEVARASRQPKANPRKR
jgi:tetratricopeptide (TPR) repeat protein